MSRRGFFALAGATAVLGSQAGSSASSQAAVVTPTLGVTHTQYSLDSWNSAAQVASGEAILSATPLVQNQHIMGWGVLSPEPSPGTYDWTRLDARMALIKNTGGIGVLTLAGAPDWMKGGVSGQTDWSLLAGAPTAAHYQDFAALCAKVAVRYSWVRYFQVWNELKGFWDSTTQTWDYKSYTALYDTVYKAVKEVRPDALIGGPYIVLQNLAPSSGIARSSSLSGSWGMIDQRALDALEYWSANRAGADFVTVDTSTATTDQGLLTDPFTANTLFAAVTKWVSDTTGLPVWWSEFYPDQANSWTPESTQLAALTLDAVARAVEGGAARVLLWQPQAESTLDYAALWSTTDSTSVVATTALTTPWTWLAARLPNSAMIKRTTTLLQFVSSNQTLRVNLTEPYDIEIVAS
jgi:hypothetical protein